MIETPPILITGIPRSGATMVAAAINACGAFCGGVTKRSMYCNDRIKANIVAPYLDWEKLQPGLIPCIWKKAVSDVMIRDGYKEGPWMYKDSTSTLIWPVWQDAYPDAKWIIVRRKTNDIVNSCMKTTYMTEYDTKEGWLEMVHKYEKHFNEMVAAKLNYKELWPERMVQGDYSQLYSVVEWAGLTWNDKALEYIESLLWGAKQKERSKI